MRFIKFAVVALAFSLWALSAGAASISLADTASHVGETATVCGLVARKICSELSGAADFPGHGAALPQSTVRRRHLRNRLGEIRRARNDALGKADLHHGAGPQLPRQA